MGSGPKLFGLARVHCTMYDKTRSLPQVKVGGAVGGSVGQIFVWPVGEFTCKIHHGNTKLAFMTAAFLN